MKQKLNKVKLILLDVDNTALCIKLYDNNGLNDNKNGKRIIGVKDDMEWLRYNIINNAYKYCEAPLPIVNVVNYVVSNGGKAMGLTECKNSFEYNSKYNRLKECYAGSFLHHGDLISVDTRHIKIPVIKMLAEHYNLQLDEIMFIDDSYMEVMEAAAEGILAIHTTEAMMRFNSMDDFSTNGVSIEAYSEKSKH